MYHRGWLDHSELRLFWAEHTGINQYFEVEGRLLELSLAVHSPHMANRVHPVRWLMHACAGNFLQHQELHHLPAVHRSSGAVHRRDSHLHGLQVPDQRNAGDKWCVIRNEMFFSPSIRYPIWRRITLFSPHLVRLSQL